MSLGFVVARMRGSVSRRCSRIEMPMRASTPAMPPETMARICLAPELMKGS